MPLFEVGPDGLVPLQRLDQAVGDFDRQIEDALWRDPDPVYGARLLRIQQRPMLSGGGRPTLIAIDSDGRLVIVHARQRVDRNELAECLEYFGWARAASLDELATLYWRGEEVFRADWKRFADDERLTKLAANPKLVLVAGELADRTTATFQLLVENGLPLTIATMGVWRSAAGTLLLDVGDPGTTFGRVAQPVEAAGRSNTESNPADTAANRPYSSVPFPARSSDSVPLSVAAAEVKATPIPVQNDVPAAGPITPTPTPVSPAPVSPARVSPTPVSPASAPSPAASAPTPAMPTPAMPTPAMPAPAATTPPERPDESGRPGLAPVARGGRANRRAGVEPATPTRGGPGLTVVGDSAGRSRPVGTSRGVEPIVAPPAEAPRPAGPPPIAAGLSVVPDAGPPSSRRHEPAAESPDAPDARAGDDNGRLGGHRAPAMSVERRDADPLNDPIGTLNIADGEPFPPRPQPSGRHGQPVAEPPADQSRQGLRLDQPRRPLPSGSERERARAGTAEQARRSPFPDGPGEQPTPGRAEADAPPVSGIPAGAGLSDSPSGADVTSVLGTAGLGAPPEFGPPPTGREEPGRRGSFDEVSRRGPGGEPGRRGPDGPRGFRDGPQKPDQGGHDGQRPDSPRSPGLEQLRPPPPDQFRPQGADVLGADLGPRRPPPPEPLRPQGFDPLGPDPRRSQGPDQLGPDPRRQPPPDQLRPPVPDQFRAPAAEAHRFGDDFPGERGARPGQATPPPPEPADRRGAWGGEPGDQPPAPDPRFGQDRDLAGRLFERPTDDVPTVSPSALSGLPSAPRSAPPSQRPPYEDGEDDATNEIQMPRPPRIGRPPNSGRASVTGQHPLPQPFSPAAPPFPTPSDRPFGAGGPGGPGPGGSGPNGLGQGPGPRQSPDFGGHRDGADAFRRPEGFGAAPEWDGPPPPPPAEWDRADLDRPGPDRSGPERRRGFDDRRPDPNGPDPNGPGPHGPDPNGPGSGGPGSSAPGPYGEPYWPPSGPPATNGWPGTPEWPVGPSDPRDGRDPRDPHGARDDWDARDPQGGRDVYDDREHPDDQQTVLRTGPTLVWDARSQGDMMHENGGR